MKKLVAIFISIFLLMSWGFNSFAGTVDISPSDTQNGSGTSSFEINGYIGSYSLYNITLSNTPHGKILANKSKALAGDYIQLSIVPDMGYELKKGTLSYNGKPIQGTSFYMPSSHVTVTAEFVPITETKYSVSIGYFVGGKIISSKVNYHNNELVQLMVQPKDGYRLKFDSLKYVWNDNEYKISGTNFYMPAGDVKVLAEFETYTQGGDEIPKGIIVLPPTSGGTIETDIQEPFAGDVITLIVKPDNGYQLKDNTLTLTFTNKDGLEVIQPISGNSVITPYAIENGSDLIIKGVFITDEEALNQGQKIRYKIELPDLTDVGYLVTSSQYLAVEGDLIQLQLLKTGVESKKISFQINGFEITGMSFYMPEEHVVVTAKVEEADQPIIPGVSIQSTVSLNHSFMVNPNLSGSEGFSASQATFKNTSNVPLTYTIVSMKAKNGPKVSDENGWDWDNLGKKDTMEHIALGFENDDKHVDFYFEEEGKQSDQELFTLVSGDTDTVKLKAKYGKAWVESVNASYTCTIRIDIAS